MMHTPYEMTSELLFIRKQINSIVLSSAVLVLWDIYLSFIRLPVKL